MQQLSSSMTCSCGVESEDRCKQLFEEVLVKEFSDINYARVHRLTVDMYSLQHPNYVASAKSFAVHLTGMCVAMEHGNDRKLLRTLQQWLCGSVKIQKPAPLLDFVGNLTTEHIAGAADAIAHASLVREWAKDVWSAFGSLHGLADEWIATAKRGR